MFKFQCRQQPGDGNLNMLFLQILHNLFPYPFVGHDLQILRHTAVMERNTAQFGKCLRGTIVVQTVKTGFGKML